MLNRQSVTSRRHLKHSATCVVVCWPGTIANDRSSALFAPQCKTTVRLFHADESKNNFEQLQTTSRTYVCVCVCVSGVIGGPRTPITKLTDCQKLQNTNSCLLQVNRYRVSRSRTDCHELRRSQCYCDVIESPWLIRLSVINYSFYGCVHGAAAT